MVEEKITLNANKGLIKIEVTKDTETGLIKNDLTNVYGYGIFEGSVTRSNKLLEDLKPVFQKHGIVPQISRSLKCETVKTNDPFVPLASSPGEAIMFSVLVSPVDKVGNDNKVWITEKEYVEWYDKANTFSK